MDKIGFNGIFNIDAELFTTDKQSKLSLSNMALRLFGFPMDKNFQSWIAENEDLDCEDERNYAILDALAPIMIFNKVRGAMEQKIKKDVFIVNCDDSSKIDRSEYLLDQQLDQLKDYFAKINRNYTVLKEKTYDGTSPSSRINPYHPNYQ